MMKMEKKKKLSSSVVRKNYVTRPYVIYKLNCNDRKSILISNYASLIDNDDKLSKVITLIKNNGNRLYGAKFSANLRTGKLIYRSSDGLYGIWKNNLNYCLYLLLYVDYGEIKSIFKKWVN